MRLPALEECTTDLQREVGYHDDVHQFFHPRSRKPGPFSSHLRMDQVVRAFADFVPPPAEVADIACAAGNFALMLAERGYKVTGVDLLEDLLIYAEKKRTHGEIGFVHGNLMDYRHPRPLDGILMGEVIEHVAWPEQLIAAAAENLRKGGLFVLTTPNGTYGGNDLPTFSSITSDRREFEGKQFHHGHHLFLYTPAELRGLLERGGFELLRIEVFNSHFLTKSGVFRYFFSRKCLMRLDRILSLLPFRGGSSANMMIAVARKR
jgi:2-polyprenyl-3-methyl-5-hydroxy-6-metoxy-1,4-benzoquinol methylase